MNVPPVDFLLSPGATSWHPWRFCIAGTWHIADLATIAQMAGRYPTAWAGVYSVQESMANEPLGGWHRIHLFSTTLHRIGIGIYIDARGWPWFTEDMVS